MIVTIILNIMLVIIKMKPTCHNDRFAQVFQHEGQGGAGVGEGVRPVQNNKPDDGDDEKDDSDGDWC